MDILKKVTISVLAGFMLTGCYSKFDLDVESEPVLCLNSIIIPGDSIRLQVIRTWEWRENDLLDYQNVDVTDAEVSLYINGRLMEKMTPRTYYMVASPINSSINFYKTTTGFIADYIPASGDEIRFEAKSEKYGEATAEITIPYPVDIENVSIDVSNLVKRSDVYFESYDMTLNMLAWFSDPAPTTDYYRVSTYLDNKYWTDSGEEGFVDGWVSKLDVNHEPLFTEHISVLESIFSDESSYTIFSDRQISGNSYPLHLFIDKLRYNYYNPYDLPEFKDFDLVVELSRLSESYYKYVLSEWEANYGMSGILGSMGLSEPVYGASNVSTGAGVVAAVVPYRYRINVRQLIEEELGKSLPAILQ
ncbi:MAG: DUF4249 domain-containing protein [Muribaculaceae bacterium]|nr:DUF4249 domain-containing protein [Muribaculaceae bacterium]